MTDAEVDRLTDTGTLAAQHPVAEPPSRLRSALNMLGQLAVQVVLPDVCAGCGASGWWLCPVCADEAIRIDPQHCCQRCGKPMQTTTGRCRRCKDWPSALSQSRSAYVFSGPVREMVHRLKYHGEYARAQWCAEEMQRVLVDAQWHPSVLVSVPLHRQRVKSRGFNQSERIAVELSRRTRIPHDVALMRWRKTVPQVNLTAAERRENVRDAFVARRLLTGEDVLLIDDVQTTGATLAACAGVCESAGARSVRALTLATVS